MKKKSHERSIYLVVDPAMGSEFCLPKINQAIEGGIDYIQIWNNWSAGQDKFQFSKEIHKIASRKDIPVFINEEWELLRFDHLSGVHFDSIPYRIEKIRRTINRPFKVGLTCGNDLSTVEWAIQNKIDYISFCSMFPSSSAKACDIIALETVQQARKLTDMPIFLSGGITLNNITTLLHTGVNGIAIISGIMNAENTQYAAKQFKEHIQKTIDYERFND